MHEGGQPTNLFGRLYKHQYFGFEMIPNKEPQSIKFVVQFTHYITLLECSWSTILGLLVYRDIHRLI